MEQKLIKGFVAFSAIIICQQRMCCLNMFVIIRNEQGYFKDHSNSKPDYREKLEVELKALRESEMWQTAVTVRKLRPENN